MATIKVCAYKEFAETKICGRLSGNHKMQWCPFHPLAPTVEIEQPRPEQAGGEAGSEHGRRLGKSSTEFEINKHDFEQRFLNVECQSCDFKGTFTEGTEHGNQTGHLLQTLTEPAPTAPEGRR